MPKKTNNLTKTYLYRTRCR